MKRIEFIAPVEAMRGNLSGRQKLEYPTDNQGAYEGPVGSVNYARNYSARFIGAKIAKSGKKYFSVRTKTANHLTAKAKKAMALLGGTGAIVGAIFANKSSELYANLYAQWIELQNLGDTKTFRQSLSDAVRAGLISKSEKIVYAGPRGVVYIINPWARYNETPNVSISQEVLVKFWTELAPQPAFVGYAEGLPFLSYEFARDLSSVAGKTNLNLCGLKVVEVRDPRQPVGGDNIEGLTLLTDITESGGVQYCHLLMLNGEYADPDADVYEGMQLSLDNIGAQIVG